MSRYDKYFKQLTSVEIEARRINQVEIPYDELADEFIKELADLGSEDR